MNPTIFHLSESCLTTTSGFFARGASSCHRTQCLVAWGCSSPKTEIQAWKNEHNRASSPILSVSESRIRKIVRNWQLSSKKRTQPSAGLEIGPVRESSLKNRVQPIVKSEISSTTESRARKSERNWVWSPRSRACVTRFRKIELIRE